MREQQGVLGKMLGGWQVSSFFTFQSGAPFTRAQRLRSDRRDRGHRRAGRQRHPSDAQHRPRPVEDDHRGDPSRRAAPACSGRCAACPARRAPGERVGNVGRNTLRADGIGNVDFGFTKNTRFANGQNIQLRIEMFNATNTRNFGNP